MDRCQTQKLLASNVQCDRLCALRSHLRASIKVMCCLPGAPAKRKLAMLCCFRASSLHPDGAANVGCTKRRQVDELVVAAGGEVTSAAEPRSNHGHGQTVPSAAAQTVAIEAMLCSLSSSAGCISVFTACGRTCLYQNNGSREYLGELMGSSLHDLDPAFTVLGTGPDAELQFAQLPVSHPLRQLFGRGMAARLLQRKQLLSGEAFRQLMTVPVSMRPQSQDQLQQYSDHETKPFNPQSLLVPEGGPLGSLLLDDLWHQSDSGASNAPAPNVRPGPAPSPRRRTLKQRFFSASNLLRRSEPKDALGPHAMAPVVPPSIPAPTDPCSSNTPAPSAQPYTPTTLRPPYQTGLPTTREHPSFETQPSLRLSGHTHLSRHRSAKERLRSSSGRILSAFGALAVTTPRTSNTFERSTAHAQAAPKSHPWALATSDEVVRPTASESGPGKQQPQAPRRSTSFKELSPKHLAYQLRCLSLTNWDKRAMFAMPQVRIDTEDAASRQMQLVHASNATYDSYTGSTNPPSEVISEFRLPGRASVDARASGHGDISGPLLNRLWYMRPSSCGHEPILEEESAAVQPTDGEQQVADGGVGIDGSSKGPSGGKGAGGLGGAGSSGQAHKGAGLVSLDDVGVRLLPMSNSGQVPSFEASAAQATSATTVGMRPPRLAGNLGRDAPTTAAAGSPWALSPAVPMPTVAAKTATPEAHFPGPPLQPAGGQTAREGPPAMHFLAHYAGADASVSRSKDNVGSGEGVVSDATQGIDTAAVLAAMGSTFGARFESIDQGEGPRNTDLTPNAGADRRGDGAKTSRPEGSTLLPGQSFGRRRYQRFGTLERLSRMLATPVPSLDGPRSGAQPEQTLAATSRNHSMPVVRHQHFSFRGDERDSTLECQRLQLFNASRATQDTQGGPASGVIFADGLLTGRRSSAQGAAAPHAAVTAQRKSTTTHEVILQLVSGEAAGCDQPLLVLIQHELRNRVSGALLQLLREEHKLLEAIFPKHVLRHVIKRVKANLEQDGAPSSVAAVHTEASGALATLADRTSRLAGGASRKLDPASSGPAAYHSMVTVLFCDIVGFTSMCKSVEPIVVMDFLNSLYSKFDDLTDIYGCYKVETVGDCYMVASGLVDAHSSRSRKTLALTAEEQARMCALKALSFAKAVLLEATTVLMPTTGRSVRLRVGLHSGPVMSGIVGTKMPRLCLFGDTVNTASRMESTCPHEAVQISVDTWKLLDASEQTRWAARGGVQVKGKGEMMTYTWSWHNDTNTRTSA